MTSDVPEKGGITIHYRKEGKEGLGRVVIVFPNGRRFKVEADGSIREWHIYDLPYTEGFWGFVKERREQI